MPYAIDTHETHDNIIVVTYTGLVTPDEVNASVDRVLELAAEMPRPLYQIGDFRQADGNFANVLQIAMKTFARIQKLYNEHDITGPIVVNQITNPWLRLSRDLAQRFNLGSLMTFESIEAAVEYILAKETPTKDKAV